MAYCRYIHVDSITKLNIRLVKILVNYLNGTTGFEYYDSWGYKKPSEKIYSGMIGAMQHGNAELGCKYVACCAKLFINFNSMCVISKR